MFQIPIYYFIYIYIYEMTYIKFLCIIYPSCVTNYLKLSDLKYKCLLFHIVSEVQEFGSSLVIWSRIEEQLSGMVLFWGFL